ncbi:hypothetical protein AAFG13_17375 [Bradyrhizobium sp. B124]|uniref:hypothetical protein n=1 Tax=Bradyrhizobium sp. B124 TaxID=3140245 RepID=UPI0031846271
MEAAVDRVMQTYGMLVSMTEEELQAERQRLVEHLSGIEADEKALAVEGLRFLRGYRPSRTRTTKRLCGGKPLGASPR